ncbi:DUF937 domain-containing protein [Lyngbya sp. CCY1209]|uniref:DUF937 domain-containing protein n=1 Tax=Lyngbya sp. CCY1209 TaxID=2886103 RepID=UPI002D210ABA|nr:DUF937 domain-containing protein [Lyngbya sp. CCY1209]MEB3886577.1 DUF937 domain-containing protein [Lyngbya sp. CCY1209]
MGLFDQIVGALNDPQAQANAGQLGNLINTAQQLSTQLGASPETTQTLMSVAGGYVRSALQEKRSQEGDESVQTFVNEHGGTNPDPVAVQGLFSPQQQNQLIETVCQRTGLDSQTIQSLLPMVVPMILNFLQTGTNTQNPRQAQNPVLSGFLDADGDGDVDMADTLKMASKFLNR